MGDKSKWLKSKLSEIPLPKLLLVLAAAFLLMLFLPKIIHDIPFYLLMIGILAVITLNGNSIMNEGGLDIATLLHFGILIVYGIYAGIASLLVSTAIAVHLSKIHTPIDFYIQKNFAKVLIQSAQILFTTLFTWAVLAFYGYDFIIAHLPVIFILAFTAGRVVKATMLLMFARVPPMKVFIGTVMFYIVNWYIIKFLGMPYLNFLHTL